MTSEPPKRIMVSACGTAIVTQETALPDDVEYVLATDRIEALQAENERLREALAAAQSWIVDGGHVDDDDVRDGQTGARAVYEQICAALGKEET
mgnify:CR=1 FL=1